MRSGPPDLFRRLPPTLPDPTAVDPRPKPWDDYWIDEPGRTISVIFGRGAQERLHHVEVDDRPDAVTITIFPGHERSFADRISRGERVAVFLYRAIERFDVVLDEPLGERRAIGGGLNGRSRPVRCSP